MKTAHNGHFWLFECPGCSCAHYADERWQFNGDQENPTFSPSILVKSTRYPSGGEFPTDEEKIQMMDGVQLQMVEHLCHSFVRNGKIEYLADCTHALAGQTVELPDL